MHGGTSLGVGRTGKEEKQGRQRRAGYAVLMPGMSHPTQVYHAVLHGERPAVPPREELPGPDTATFAGLDAYCQLMR